MPNSKEVYVWGDSHFRNFFPFLNTGSPGIAVEKNGITIIDMVANELSGATAYGLVNPNSKNGARRRVLGDLDKLKESGVVVKNVAFTFLEVDCRYHNHNYFDSDGSISNAKVIQTLARYRQFIEDVLSENKSIENVFVYFGYDYPKGEKTLLQPGLEIGGNYYHAIEMIAKVKTWLPKILSDSRVHPICPMYLDLKVSDDGVHLDPAWTFEHITFPVIEGCLGPL